jgi:ABC-type branched-subunit amino acid transport system ATPase component
MEHLRVHFPDVVVFDDPSLTVAAGEVCGLIGPWQQWQKLFARAPRRP